ARAVLHRDPLNARLMTAPSMSEMGVPADSGPSTETTKERIYFNNSLCESIPHVRSQNHEIGPLARTQFGQGDRFECVRSGTKSRAAADFRSQHLSSPIIYRSGAQASLFRRVLRLPRILHLLEGDEFDIGVPPVDLIDLADIDVLHDVARLGIDRDRSARTVGVLPM